MYLLSFINNFIHLYLIKVYIYIFLNTPNFVMVVFQQKYKAAQK